MWCTFISHNMLPSFQPRSASGVNLSQSAPSANQVSQAANGSQMSPEAYRAKHEITIVVCDQLIHSFHFYLNVTLNLNHSCLVFRCYLVFPFLLLTGLSISFINRAMRHLHHS